jgi:hypothetical protein
MTKKRIKREKRKSRSQNTRSALQALHKKQSPAVQAGPLVGTSFLPLC